MNLTKNNLFSLFVKSHLFGTPVVTPIFFHAKPGDQIAYYIDNQMFWGSDLLIVPALSENQNQVQAYLPRLYDSGLFLSHIIIVFGNV